MLPTALLYVLENETEKKTLMRAMLDQCSQTNLISENAVQTLGLKKRKSAFKIYGVGAEQKTTNSEVNIKVNETIKVNAIVMDRVIKYVKAEGVDKNGFKHFENLKLADPEESNMPIDILLGAAVYGKAIKHGLIKGKNNEPIAQNIIFGWIISGDNVKNQYQIHESTLFSTGEIDQNLKKFFSTEDILDSTTKLTEEEQFCEQHFHGTHKRNVSHEK